MELLRARKNRALRREIDNEYRWKFLGLNITYVLFIGSSLWIAREFGLKNSIVISASFVLALASLPSARMIYAFEQSYAHGSGRWRQLFSLSWCLQASIWSFSFVLCANHLVNSSVFYIFTTIYLLIGVFSGVVFLPYIKEMRVVFSLLFIPIIFKLLLSGRWEHVLMSAVILIFTSMFFLCMNRAAEHFWVWKDSELKLKRMESDIKSVSSKAQADQTGKTELLMTISHGIRTPMSSILGMLSLLGDSFLNHEQRTLQAVALKSGESLLALVDDLIDYSNIMTRSIVLEINVFDYRKAIWETVCTYAPLAHENGVEINCVFTGDVPRRVIADEQRLNKVLSSFVTNAINLSDKGEILIEFIFTPIGASRVQLRVEVVDEGRSLTKEEKDVIFNPFTISEGVYKPLGDTAALNLSIAKGIVSSMEGDVGIDSGKGQGNCFWFTAELEIASIHTARRRMPAELNAARLLLLDGSEGLKKSMTRECEQFGFQLDHVSGYDNALQHMRSAYREGKPYLVLLMDLKFDDFESLKLSRIVSEDPKLAQTKQVLLSSCYQRSHREVLRHHAKVPNLKIVPKPLNGEMLIAVMKSLCHLGIEKMKGASFSSLDSRAQNRTHILLAEDNKVNQIVAKGMLARLGYVTTAVPNGQALLEAYKEGGYDLIFMDCIMPEIDGYQATKAVRAIEKEINAASQSNVGQVQEQHIPIIAMTANTLEGEESHCLAVGMDDFMSKPVRLDTLASKLHRWLGEDKGKGSGVIMTQASIQNEVKGAPSSPMV